MENEYGNNLVNLQQSINDKALSQYNTVYQNYLSSKQQEYENQQAELARQEAIRQYNENLALQKAQLEYQKQQDAIANAQKWASINNSYSSSKKSGSSESLEFSNNSKDGLTEEGNKLYLLLNSSMKALNIGSKVANAFGAKNDMSKINRQNAINTITKAYKNGSIDSNDVKLLVSKLGLE